MKQLLNCEFTKNMKNYETASNCEFMKKYEKLGNNL